MDNTGEKLAQALTILTTNRRIDVIKEVYKDMYDEHINIPEFQKPLCETFDYQFHKLLIKIEKEGTFYNVYNWALTQLRIKKVLQN